MQKHMIHFSPREAGGGSSAEGDEKPVEEKGPRTIRIGEEELPEEEVVRGYKGTKETTQRFQKVAEDEKRVAQRQAEIERRVRELEEREQRLNATRDELLATVASRNDGKPEERPRPRLRERLKEFDFVGSEDAGERVGALFDEEWEARQAELQTRHEAELKKVRQELGSEVDMKLKQVREEVVGVSTRTVAVDRIDRQNRETFDRVLGEEFGGVTLNAQQRAAIERKYRQKIGQDYGTWDAAAGAWVANDEAVRDAIWSVPEVRDRLVKAQRAEARGEGLLARERGERATESTPGRSSRPASTDPDQALLQKYHDLRAAIAQGTLDSEDAYSKLTLKESQRLLELREIERRRQKVAAAG